MTWKPKALFGVAFLLVLILFFGLDDSFLTAKEGVKRWLPPFIILVVIPVCMYHGFRDFNFTPLKRQALSLLSTILIGPTYGFWSGYQTDRLLKNDGVTTLGVVYKKSESSNTGEWHIKCKFEAGGQQFFTFAVKDELGRFNEGDTLTILYSQSDPDNNLILELSDQEVILDQQLERFAYKIVEEYSSYLESEEGKDSHRIKIYSLRFFEDNGKCFFYIGTDIYFDPEMEGYVLIDDNILTFSNVESSCNKGLIEIHQKWSGTRFENLIDFTDTYAAVNWVFQVKGDSIIPVQQGRFKINFE
jgi:hypothetical protein